jgi:hypothetical protein
MHMLFYNHWLVAREREKPNRGISLSDIESRKRESEKENIVYVYRLQTTCYIYKKKTSFYHTLFFSLLILCFNLSHSIDRFYCF